LNSALCSTPMPTGSKSTREETVRLRSAVTERNDMRSIRAVMELVPK
jgi:hypothetical protein